MEINENEMRFRRGIWSVRGRDGFFVIYDGYGKGFARQYGCWHTLEQIFIHALAIALALITP